MYQKCFIFKLMSLDKIRNNRIYRPSDSYSRNPIINNLIRNKLETQIGVVKDNVNKIIKNQESSVNLLKSNSMSRLKRQKSYNLTPRQINQNLQYNPVQRIQNLVQQFITGKQLQSYIIPKEQLQNIHKARQQPGLNVKFKKSDQINYETSENVQKLYEQVKNKSKTEYKGDIWLPDKPEIEYLITDKLQFIEEANTFLNGSKNMKKIVQQEQKFRSSLIPQSTSSAKNKNNQFKAPLTSYENKTKGITIPDFPTEYNTSRYHKDDYNGVQKWLDNSMAKLAEKIACEKNNYSINKQLNLVFTLYISAWKQLIRLTYIESYEKGILFEKIIYSMLRLFSNIIEQEHINAKEYQQSRQKDVESLKKMLENRCEELSKRYQQNLDIIKDLTDKNHRLSISFIAYEKVNKQLVLQTQILSQINKKTERQLNQINRAYVRSLQKLADRGLIEVQIDAPKQQKFIRKKDRRPQPSYKTYYMIGGDNKPLTLGRFKYIEGGNSGQFANKNQNLQIQGSQQMLRYNKVLQNLDNEINRFWSKKQDDLELKGTINSSLLNIKISDASTGTLQIQPINIGCQFPQTGQNLFEKLLQEQKRDLQSQFKIERQSLQNQINQKDKLLEKWITNNETNTEKIKNLQQTIHNLQDSLKKQKQANQQIHLEIVSRTKQNQNLSDSIQQFKKNKLFTQNQLQILSNRLETAETQANKAIKAMQIQKDNNNYLVRNSLKAQQLAQKQTIRHNTLLQKIKKLAPSLQKYMAEVDRANKQNEQQLLGLINLEILLKTSDEIVNNLGQYVERDCGLFNMTKI